jgi:hypothetical protein
MANDQGIVMEPVPPSDLEEVKKFWKRLGYTVAVESVGPNFRVTATKVTSATAAASGGP